MANTEDRLDDGVAVDALPLDEAVMLMLREQQAALAAIAPALPALTLAAEAAAGRLRHGAGRLVYAGSGTSGRLGALDGVELGPTYGWPPDRLLLLIAGGAPAMLRSAEGAEDDAAAAAAEVAAAALGPDDVLIGIAASGRTPYTLAAVRAARAAGALTIAITSNAATPLADAADHALVAETGSEVIAGSTRMKAGTAQKVLLTMLSTAIMLQLGRVYRGMMVNMQISNAKLLARGQRVVGTLAGCSADAAAAALALANHDIPAAILIARGDSHDAALARLGRNGGMLAAALAEQEHAG